MSEKNLAEPSDSSEEQVSGATVIAQALKAQVRLSCSEGKAPTEAGGAREVLETRTAAGVGRREVRVRFSF